MGDLWVSKNVYELTVTQEEDCLRVHCGGSACAEEEEWKGTNIVVSSDAIARQLLNRQIMW